MSKKRNKKKTQRNNSVNASILTVQTLQVATENIIINIDNLKTQLSKSYEKGCEDTRENKWKLPYSIFLSIGFTLVISCVTVDFKQIGECSATAMSHLFYLFCGLSFVIAIILGLVSWRKYRKINDNEHKRREQAVQERISSLNIKILNERDYYKITNISQKHSA